MVVKRGVILINYYICTNTIHTLFGRQKGCWIEGSGRSYDSLLERILMSNEGLSIQEDRQVGESVASSRGRNSR